MVVVAVQERRDRVDSLLLAGPGLGVETFLGQGPVEPFDLAVGLRPVGPGVSVSDPLAQCVVERSGPVAGAVIGQYPADHLDAVGREVSACLCKVRGPGSGVKAPG